MEYSSSIGDSREELIKRFICQYSLLENENEIEKREELAALVDISLEQIKDSFQENRLDPLLSKIEELLSQSQSANQEIERIKKIYHDFIRQKPLAGYGLYNGLCSTAYSIYSTACCIPSVVYHLPWTVGGICYDSVIDGNHPWKKKKYLLNLKVILNNFSNEGLPLLDIKKRLYEIEGPFTEPEEKTREVIDLLLQADQEIDLDTYDIRANYENFILKLREVIQLPSFQEELVKRAHNEPHLQCVDIIQKICHYRFSEVHLYSFCEQLVRLILEKGYEELLKTYPEKYKDFEVEDKLDLPLEIQFDAVHAAPQAYKAPHVSLLLGTIQPLFGSHDPQLSSNMPYVLYDFQMKNQENEELQTIRVLRTGTPTNHYSNKIDVEINPEFETFLIDNKFLFIRLEDEQKRMIGDESIRNTAFKKFREQHPENFFLCILANDTDFYHQQGEFDDKSEITPCFLTIDEFKAAFLNEMLSEDKVGYFFPPEWKQDSQFVERLSLLMDEVQYDFFDQKEVLFKEDRCHFIMALHMRIPLELQRKTGANYLACCCKDSIDRANILSALLQYYILILLKKEGSPEHIRIFKVFIHAAAMIVKKREMNGRKARFLSFFQLLQNPQIIERLRQRKEEIGIAGDDIYVKKLSNQSIDIKHV